MGRNKCFKKEDVLDKSINLFWELGFSETSLAEIEKATGVNKSGLYTEFKSKEDLYAQCVDWYSKNCGIDEVLLKEPLGEKNIENFLLASTSSKSRQGCFIANSVREYSILPDQAKDVIASHNSKAHASVVKNLKTYIKNKDVDALAKLILIYKSGLALSLNMGEVDKLKKQVSYFLEGLKANKTYLNS
jgi:AcrR family transcriptional regulator